MATVWSKPNFPVFLMSMPSLFCVTASIHRMTLTEADLEPSRTSTMEFFDCVLDKPLLKAFNFNVVITKPFAHTCVSEDVRWYFYISGLRPNSVFFSGQYSLFFSVLSKSTAVVAKCAVQRNKVGKLFSS